MNTYTFSFRGIYPSGEFIAVIADNQAEAEDMATKVLIHHELDCSSLELYHVINTSKKSVCGVDEQMNTYIFSFRGIYPVGAFIAVIAGNEAEAEDMATKALIHHELNWSSLELDHVMNNNKKSVYVISDGDY